MTAGGLTQRQIKDLSQRLVVIPHMEKTLEAIMNAKGCSRREAADAIRIAAINWMITETLFSGSTETEIDVYVTEGGE